MSIEVSCGNCQGRLLIEQAGVVVACPHCGTHLSIDAPTEPADETAPAVAQAEALPVSIAPEPAAEVAAPAFEAPAVEAPAFEAPAVETPAVQSPAFESPVSEASQEVTTPTADLPGEPMPFLGDVTPPGTTAPDAQAFAPSLPAVETQPSAMPAVETPQFGFGAASVGGAPETLATGFAPAESGQPVFPTFTDPVSVAAVPAEIAPAPTSEMAAVSALNPAPAPAPALGQTAAPELTNASPQPAVTTAEAVPSAAFTPAQHSEEVVPKRLFKMALSYGIVATLAVLYLGFQVLSGKTQEHQLESLPDVVPPKTKTKSGETKIGYKLIPEEIDVPPGHTLSLGEERRFGNVLVTPLRVSREPIEFVHFMGEGNRTKAPGKEVLKLWLRFENVSEDQEIAPLDKLVFRRGTRKGDDLPDTRSNTFLCRLSEKKADGELVLAYELNTNDEWVLKDQRAELAIKPGESIESYVPTTEEGLGELLSEDEELVWRVHFRKGYSPKNYGVTTVIEVRFAPSEIGGTSEPAADKHDDAKSA
jgi:hypothetical protein